MKKKFLLLVIAMIMFSTGCTKKIDEKPAEISLETQNIVKEYVKENISDLSPEKAVLGGSFYVTKIDFENPDLILIEYEDGHIALKAKANFTLENKQTQINNFQLINDEENEVVVTNEYLKCNSHDDCVPLPGCHSRECINKEYQKNYEQPEICTMMYDNCAAYEDNDCICQQGTCFNENLMNPECN